MFFIAPLIALFFLAADIVTASSIYINFGPDGSLWVYKGYSSNAHVTVKIFDPQNPSVPIVKKNMTPVLLSNWPVSLSSEDLHYLKAYEKYTPYYIRLTGKDALPGAGRLHDYKIEFSTNGWSEALEFTEQYGHIQIKDNTPPAYPTSYVAWFQKLPVVNGASRGQLPSNFDGSIGRR